MVCFHMKNMTARTAFLLYGQFFCNRKFRHSVEEPEVLPNIMPKAFCSAMSETVRKYFGNAPLI